MSATDIRKVSWSDVLRAENGGLISEYAEECAQPEIAPIDPQPAAYEALEVAGVLQSLGVYDNAHLVGFAEVMTCVLPHFGVQFAVMDGLFVSSSLRSQGHGTALLRAIPDYARQSGSRGVFYTAMPGSRLERLMLAKSYLRAGTMFYQGV